MSASEESSADDSISNSSVISTTQKSFVNVSLLPNAAYNALLEDVLKDPRFCVDNLSNGLYKRLLDGVTMDQRIESTTLEEEALECLMINIKKDDRITADYILSGNWTI